MNRFRTAAVALLGFLALHTSANAAAIYQYKLTLTDVGSQSFNGLGQIGFNALTGSSSFGLDNFSFNLTSLDGAPSGELPRSFDFSDISNIAWKIDPVSYALVGLNLDTYTQSSGNTRWDLSIDTFANGTPYVTCYDSAYSQSYDAVACYAQNRNSEDFAKAAFSSTLTSAPATSVPEPGTLGLFGAALIGMAMAKRRRAQG